MASGSNAFDDGFDGSGAGYAPDPWADLTTEVRDPFSSFSGGDAAVAAGFGFDVEPSPMQPVQSPPTVSVSGSASAPATPLDGFPVSSEVLAADGLAGAAFTDGFDGFDAPPAVAPPHGETITGASGFSPHPAAVHPTPSTDEHTPGRRAPPPPLPEASPWVEAPTSADPWGAGVDLVAPDWDEGLAAAASPPHAAQAEIAAAAAAAEHFADFDDVERQGTSTVSVFSAAEAAAVPGDSGAVDPWMPGGGSPQGGLSAPTSAVVAAVEEELAASDAYDDVPPVAPGAATTPPSFSDHPASEALAIDHSVKPPLPTSGSRSPASGLPAEEDLSALSTPERASAAAAGGAGAPAAALFLPLPASAASTGTGAAATASVPTPLPPHALLPLSSTITAPAQTADAPLPQSLPGEFEAASSDSESAAAAAAAAAAALLEWSGGAFGVPPTASAFEAESAAWAGGGAPVPTSAASTSPPPVSAALQSASAQSASHPVSVVAVPVAVPPPPVAAVVTPHSSAAVAATALPITADPDAGAAVAAVAAVPAPAPTPAAPSAPAPAEEGGGGSFLGGLVSLPPLPPLPQPAPPVLSQATISSLTLSWEAVPGAVGYWLDYEPRSQVGREDLSAAVGVWTGLGARAVIGGSALLLGTSVRLTGLQKDAVYVARLTAVRKRLVVLPGGGGGSSSSSSADTVLEQTLESPPSAPSALLRTLAPAAEIARLQAHNAALIAENARIPVLEQQLADLDAAKAASEAELRGELDEAGAALAGAVTEIGRLETDLAGRAAELKHGEIRHLREVLATRTEELARATAEGARLGALSAQQAAALDAAAKESSAQASALTARDASIAALRSRVAELEATVAARDAKLRDAQAAEKAAAGRARLAEADKDVLVAKLTDDLGKVMGELQRVQGDLHRAQDHVVYLEPIAKLVLDVRRRQAAWDKEHAAIEAGLTGFAKMSAKQRLGPRPSEQL